MKPMTYILAGALAVTAAAAHAQNAQMGAQVGASGGGSVQTGAGGVSAGADASTRPTGVINDTSRSGGTSSVSTQGDANARMNTTGRGGTFSGRSTTHGNARLGVDTGVSSTRY